MFIYFDKMTKTTKPATPITLIIHNKNKTPENTSLYEPVYKDLRNGQYSKDTIKNLIVNLVTKNH